MSLAPSTTYAVSTASHTFTSSSALITETFTLAPQTTPWTAPGSCSVSIFCSMKGSEVGPGKQCWDFNIIDSTTKQYINSACFPSGYKDIFYHGTSYQDLVTIAFPGDSCPRGWFKACTPSLSSGSAIQTQQLCCPEGYNGCATDGAVRNCYRILTTATAIWALQEESASQQAHVIVTKTPLTGSDSEAITIYRPAFPLSSAALNGGKSDSSGVWTAASNNSAQDGMPGPDGDKASSSGTSQQQQQEGRTLSPGAIAGIALGGAVALALLAATGFFILKHRRKAARGPNGSGPLERALITTNSDGGDASPDPGKASPSQHGLTPPFTASKPNARSSSATLLPTLPGAYDALPSPPLWESPASVGLYSGGTDSPSRLPSPGLVYNSEGAVVAYYMPAVSQPRDQSLLYQQEQQQPIELDSNPPHAPQPPVEMDAAGPEPSWAPTSTGPYYPGNRGRSRVPRP